MTNDIDEFFSTARTTGQEGAVELAQGSFRDHLYPLDHDVVAPYRSMTYEEFTTDRYRAPFLRDLLDYWRSLYEQPFVGITTDGVVRPDLVHLPSHPVGDDSALLDAVAALLTSLDPEEAAALRHPIDSPTWRGWSNPEFVVHRIGLRLEDQRGEVVSRILAVVEASLSPRGYAQVREAMALNGFLGELTALPRIMNERSYWFALYGDPGKGPWGWQLFGHHVAVHFVSVGGRHVIGPVFLGGEPAVADDREPLFARREELALRLVGGLDRAQRDAAVVFASVLDPAMPEGRLHPADERHVAGAFRDNRVIPYEGVRAADLREPQRAVLREIIADALLLLRDEQREATLAEVDRHFDDTRFSWYGATDGSQPFYFRVHGPVVLTELDHHAGVWLSNRLPARFHVHTTVRMVNGHDYGAGLVARWREGATA